MDYFEKVMPEEVGISSDAVLDFLNDVKRKGIELHSLIVIRHGKCCVEGCWAPYRSDQLHPLYSFSKSLTATAIGFAWQEGILSLDEKLVDIFPEEAPECPSENLQEVNLHHLLCMSCGHETEIDCNSPDWIRRFLHHPFLHKPGTFYKYNTAGTNILAAVLKRKTGQHVTEYLQTRLLEPLGIRRIVCAHLPDQDAVELGGGGMKLTPCDMAKFAFFMLHKGMWEGKQLLDREWFEKAEAKQIETAGDSEGHVKEWANGYGYQCWQGSLPGSFRADGAYGQFGFVYPHLDMVVVTASATEQTQSLVDSMMDLLIPGVKEEVQKISMASVALDGTLGRLCIPALSGPRNPEIEKMLSGKRFLPEEKDRQAQTSLEELIGGAGLFDLAKGAVTAIGFAFHEWSVSWLVWEGQEKKEIKAALDGSFAVSQCNGHEFAASARWRSLHVLEVEVRRIDAISGARMLFFLEGDHRIVLEREDTLVSYGGLGITPRKTMVFLMQGT